MMAYIQCVTVLLVVSMLTSAQGACDLEKEREELAKCSSELLHTEQGLKWPSEFIFDNVCSMLGIMMDCVQAFDSECSFIAADKATLQDKLGKTDIALGCTVNGNAKDAECNFQDNAIPCYDNLLEEFGMPPIGKDTNWHEVLKNSYFTAIPGGFCDKIDDIDDSFVDLDECLQTYISDCRDTAADLPPYLKELLDTEPFEYMFTDLEEACEPVCDNMEVILAQFSECSPNDLHNKADAVIDLFRSGGDTTSTCTALQAIYTCVYDKAGQCMPLQQQISNEYHQVPNLGQAQGICNNNIDDLPEPIVCPDSGYLYKRLGHCNLMAYTIASNSMTSEKLCTVIQDQIDCLSHGLAGCRELEATFVHPLLHSWGMFSHMLPCADLQLYGVPIKPLQGQCDYGSMLDCYSDLLSALTITQESDNTISFSAMQELFNTTIQLVYQRDTYCGLLGDLDVTSMVECAKQELAKCEYPIEAYKDEQDTKQWNTVTGLEIQQRIDQICAEECSNLLTKEAAVSGCTTTGWQSTMARGAAINSDTKEQDKDSICQQIKAIKDCHDENSAGCPYLTKPVDDFWEARDAKDSLENCDLPYNSAGALHALKYVAVLVASLCLLFSRH